MLRTEYIVLSVCMFVGHVREPCKNGWTDRDAVWEADPGKPVEPCITWGPVLPRGRGNFWGLSTPLKSIGSLCCGVRKKRLNRSRCRLGSDSCEPKETCIRWGWGQMNPFAAARVTRWRCGLLSNFFDHLFDLATSLELLLVLRRRCRRSRSILQAKSGL